MLDIYLSPQTLLQWLGAAAGVATFAYAIMNMLVAQRRPSGQQTGVAKQMLRTPYLIIATVLFITLIYVLWKPLPLQFAEGMSLLLAVIGILIMLPGLAVYLWGLRTLGMSFNASSGFGVRLQRGHRLVTSGPFAFLRHPMYLGVNLAFWGALLLYRNWAMLVCALIMLGLVYRARKEEQAMALAFGSRWQAYKRAVPGWLPRLKPWTGGKSDA